MEQTANPPAPNPVAQFNLNKQLEFAGAVQGLHANLLVFTTTAKIDPSMRDFLIFHLDGIVNLIKNNTVEPVKPPAEPS
jgi:hypothetical protein